MGVNGTYPLDNLILPQYNDGCTDTSVFTLENLVPPQQCKLDNLLCHLLLPLHLPLLKFPELSLC